MGPTVRVVVPVHGRARDVEDVVGLVLAQLGEQDELVVVDDASPVPIDLPPHPSLRVLRLPGPGPVGPYAARNAGAALEPDGRPSPELLVFVDGRSRPTPGWLARLRQDWRPGVLLAGDVEVPPRTGAVGRAAARRPTFGRDVLEHALLLPYAAGCHLAIGAEDLAALGGFAPVRSGGDVELSWRHQLERGGRVVFSDARVVWVARDGWAAWWEQQHRYGRGATRLWRRFAAAGMPPPGPQGVAGVLRWLATVLLRPLAHRDRAAGLAGSVADVAYVAGVWRERLRPDRGW